MPLPARKYLFVIALLLCASLALDAAQKKSSTPTKKAEPAAAEPAGKPIAVHDFSAEGVQVALMEVTRTAPDVVTVKWETATRRPRNRSWPPTPKAGATRTGSPGTPIFSPTTARPSFRS